MLRVPCAILCELRLPTGAQCGSAPADAGRKVFANAVGDKKSRVYRPAVRVLREADLFFAERLAMRCARVLPVWRSIANVTVNDDERRAVGCCLERLEGTFDHI